MKLIQTRKHLAGLFGMEARWITKQLKKLGLNHRGALTPLDLEVLQKALGDPHKLKTVFSKSND